MKKIISVSTLTVLTVAMLLPVARQVNAASVNHSVFGQGGNPKPPAPGTGGGYTINHSLFGQGGNPKPPAPGTGGGYTNNYSLFGQGGNPKPPAPGTGGGQ
jgi:hypothetical protein